MIRAGTWNVLGLQGFRPADAAAELGPPGEPRSLKRWTEAFAALDCDVLLLQEGVPHDWMREIASLGGWHVATIPSPQVWPGHVLSRFPILESRVFSHVAPGSSREDPFSRCFGAARLAVPGLGECWSIVLHAFPSRPETPLEVARGLRTVEATLLKGRVESAAHSGAHVVVAGDFNSEVDESLHEVLRERGFVNAMAATGGVQPTFGKQGDRSEHYRTVDHIYLSPSLAGRLRGARVVRDEGFWYPGPEQPGRWVLSDHLPVVAELDA
jgi:endonuclease/exonuclease/phosphatase family metal-dependent hydrolase